jgi:hypothetical protein
VQEGGSEFLEIQLQTYEDGTQDVLQFLVVLDEILRVLLASQQFLETLIRGLPDSLIHPADQVEHLKNNLQSGIGQLRLIVLLAHLALTSSKNILIEEDALEEPENGADDRPPRFYLHVQVLNIEAVLLIVDEGVHVYVE